MPELPEVESARQLLARHAVGKSIVKVEAEPDDKILVRCTPDELKLELEGKRITAAHRIGKHCWLEVEGGKALLMHFGMSGGVVVEGVGAAKYVRAKDHDDSTWPPRFTKLAITLEGGGRVAYTDARRFGRIELQADPRACEPVSKLGWDALEALPPLEEFAAQLARKGRQRGIKALLLDQSFSAGVGNWVADEVLYQARVHPEQRVAVMSEDQVAALHAALRSVLQTAVEVDADSARFPSDWLFAHRWSGKKATTMPNGHRVEFVTAGGRTSAFCPAVQQLHGEGAGAAAGKGSKGKKPLKKAAEEGSEDGGDTVSGGSGQDEKPHARKPAVKRAARRTAAGEGGAGSAGEPTTKPTRKPAAKRAAKRKAAGEDAGGGGGEPSKPLRAKAAGGGGAKVDGGGAEVALAADDAAEGAHKAEKVRQSGKAAAPAKRKRK